MNRKVEKTDVGVMVGRFQVPSLHEAHSELIQSVCNEHTKVIIFLGLSPCVATRNNPLDFESRKQMILEKFPNVNVLYIKDINDDKLWSKRLDEQISDLISPNQKVTLYGGRDSFINHYFGKFQVQELEQTRFISGSEVRKEVSSKVKSSPEWRAGAIWMAYNQYPKTYTCVDVAVMNEDYTKVLLARKPAEQLYRFIGGFSSPTSKSFEDDVKRELYEEADTEIGDLKYVGSFLVDDWRYRSEVDKIKTVFFMGKCLFGSRLMAGDDICELKWFKVVDLNFSDVVPEHKMLVEAMIAELNRRTEQHIK